MGLILDRYGRILAENRPSFNLVLDERADPAVLEELQSYVELPNLEIEEIPRNRVRPLVVKEDLPLEEVARIEARQLELPGVRIQFVPLRYYPNSTMVAHVLGYVGRVSEEQLESEEFSTATHIDTVGQSGIERTYNRFLMGSHGVQRVVVNSLGRQERVLGTVPPVWGESIQLSIDQDLQLAAEKAFEGQMGAVAAVDPRNGEILAMSSFPSFDPNLFTGRVDPRVARTITGDQNHPLQNRAIQGRYAPGSTFKLAVAAAALEQELITPDTRMYCPGSVRLYGNTFRCARSAGHGNVNLVEAIAQSCNSYFYNLGAKLQIENMAQYARMLGLGASTQVDLPHEVSGLMPDPEWKRRTRNEPWYAGESVSVAVGQGAVLATVLQMAQMAAIVGSSGEVHRPRLFLRKLPAGSVPAAYGDGTHHPPTRRVAFRVPTWRGSRTECIWPSMGEADGLEGAGIGVSVSGKTGTSQVASSSRVAARNEDRPFHLRNHAVFVAFAPRVNPEIAIAVVVEHGGYGGVAAAPIAQQILDAHFHRESEERRRARPTTVAGN